VAETKPTIETFRPKANRNGGAYKPKFFNDANLHPHPRDRRQSWPKQVDQKQNELLQLQKQKLEFEMLNEKRKLAEHAELYR